MKTLMMILLAVGLPAVCIVSEELIPESGRMDSVTQFVVIRDPDSFQFEVVRNPHTFIRVTYTEADSLDPAAAYDTASGGCIENMYETLIGFAPGSTTEFVPVLSEQVPSPENGLITNGGRTYRFPIRKNVKFHSGNPLTPDVVAWSFKRNLATDPEGGPMWLLFEPLFGAGVYGSRDEHGELTLTADQLEKVIHVDRDSVVFNLKEPYAPFLAVLAGHWAVILDREFVIEGGGWNGTQEDIQRVNNHPEAGTLRDRASGTGPYILAGWDRGVEMVFERFDDYWGPRPALSGGIHRIVEDWPARKAMLLGGEADSVSVDPLHYEEMNREPDLSVFQGLTTMTVFSINFTRTVTPDDNPYLYSGKLDGEGIPPDFFADRDVRAAFAASFDRETFASDVIRGFGIPIATPICRGLPGYDSTMRAQAFEPEKAEAHFRAAFGGRVWDKGFRMDLLYFAGNEVGEGAMKLLANSIMGLNPKFRLEPRAVEWDEYMELLNGSMMPVFFIGWAADFPDPHGFVQPYMHSEGAYSKSCGYCNEEADKLIEQGVAELDPAQRKEIYHRLQEIWIEDNAGIMLYQAVMNQYFRDCVKGYVYDPMGCDPFPIRMFKKMP